MKKGALLSIQVCFQLITLLCSLSVQKSYQEHLVTPSNQRGMTAVSEQREKRCEGLDEQEPNPLLNGVNGNVVTQLAIDSPRKSTVTQAVHWQTGLRSWEMPSPIPRVVAPCCKSQRAEIGFVHVRYQLSLATDIPDQTGTSMKNDF